MGLLQSHSLYSENQRRLYSELTEGLSVDPLPCEKERHVQEWVDALIKLPLLLEQDKKRNQTLYASLTRVQDMQWVADSVCFNDYPDPIMILPNLYHQTMVGDVEKYAGRLISFLLMYGETILKYKNANIVFSEELCSNIISRRLARTFKSESILFIFNKPATSEFEFRATLAMYIRAYTSEPHSQHSPLQKGEHVTLSLKRRRE